VDDTQRKAQTAARSNAVLGGGKKRLKEKKNLGKKGPGMESPIHLSKGKKKDNWGVRVKFGSTNRPDGYAFFDKKTILRQEKKDLKKESCFEVFEQKMQKGGGTA